MKIACLIVLLSFFGCAPATPLTSSTAVKRDNTLSNQDLKEMIGISLKIQELEEDYGK
jgi:hypothetical protein